MLLQTEHALLAHLQNDKADLRHTLLNGKLIVSVFDVIEAVSHGRKSRNTWSRAQYACGHLTHLYQFSGRRQRETPVLYADDMGVLIHWVLGHTDMTKEAITLWMSRLGYDVDDSTVLVRGTRVETEIMRVIIAALKQYKISQQFMCYNYRIDLYIHELNIAVECDEYDHKHYCIIRERARTDTITKALSCTWVRFNPFSSDFNVGNVIHEIYSHILKQPALCSSS